MTEANKKSFREVLMIIGGIGAFWAFAEFVPDYSLAKNIMAVLICIALVGGAIWFTPLGNPLKRYLRKRKERK